MRLIGAIALLLLASGIALAGDASRLNMVGFSPDARYFAFEQGGNNEAGRYSTITAIEVAGSVHVQGSPIYFSEDHGEPVETARARASDLLERLKISQQGFEVVSVAEARARVEGSIVDELRRSVVKTVGLPQEWFGTDARLVVRQFRVPARRCKDNPEPVGFALTLERGGQKPLRLRADRALPEAGGCPFEYGIAEVVAMPTPEGAMALAVIVQVIVPGFESPSRRFMAVTARILQR